MFGGGLDRAGARRRPHRLPADAGRQPVRLERQPRHRPRLARPHRGADRPGRHAGRGRPAAVAHGRGGDPARGHPAGRRRLPADGARQRAGRRRAGRHRRCGGVPRRRRRGAGRGPAVHPRGRGGRDRGRRRRHPAAGPRPGGGPDRVRLRAHRHDDRALRHAHVVAGRRAQHADREPRPARRRDVPQGRGRRRQHPRHPAGRPRAEAPPPTQPGAGRGRDAG